MSQSFIKKPAASPHSALSGLGVLSSEQADQESMKAIAVSVGDQHSGTVGIAYSTDAELLRQCAASDQMSAAQVAGHHLARPAATTVDPMDTPLPCSVTVGGTTFGKGVALRTFVLAAQRWHREAFPEFYTLTPEQKAENFDRLQRVVRGDEATQP